MASKKISVGDEVVELSNDDDLYRWLDQKRVDYLQDEDRIGIMDFGSLENGGKYILGPSAGTAAGEYGLSL